jgi:alpha-methylacyl-CoA racemase
MKSDEGKAIALELAATADVIMEGFRPGVADRIGIGYDIVNATNPRVVYCAVTGYGQSGPYSQWVGHDLNYLAVAGFLSTSGRDALGVPVLPGSTIADAAGGGMHAAMAIMAALVQRATTGVGTYLDVSATEGVLGLMAMNIDEQLATGVTPEPGHGVLTGRYACYAVYECADGQYVALGAIETKFFANLCRELGLTEWTSRQYDDEAQEELAHVLRSTFAQRTRGEWITQLASAETCLTPVLSVDEVSHDPQVIARGLVSEALTPEGEHFEQLGPVWAGTPRPEKPYELAEGNSSVAVRLLQELNYPPSRIDDLIERGVVE